MKQWRVIMEFIKDDNVKSFPKDRWLELRDVDCSHLTREKQSMTYIPWNEYEVLLYTHLTNEELVPWEAYESKGVVYVSFQGYQVFSLAVSDFRNNPIDNPSAVDIENTKQRAFVKAGARTFGLGHRVYEASEYDQVDSEPKHKYRKQPTPQQQTNNRSFRTL